MRIIIKYLLAVIFVSGSARAQQTLDSWLISEMSVHHIPGLAACIVKKGHIIWSGNFGWANIENRIRVTESTLFQVASVSKTITASALMKLYEQGKFKLDDNINDYLPFKVVHPYSPQTFITFRMLLTHTSGIQDNYDYIKYYFSGNQPEKLGEYLRNYLTPGGNHYSKENYLHSSPSSVYDYCNIGIALSGYLVESISGVDFNTYCRENILKPMGMNRTSFYYHELDTNYLAMPYGFNKNYKPYGFYSYSDYPDGMLKTSTNQLARFLIAFMQKGIIENIRILDSSTVELMVSQQAGDIETGQGLVWYKEIIGNRNCWGHNGYDLGINTDFYYCPEESTGIILFTNSDYSDLNNIMEKMFAYASEY